MKTPTCVTKKCLVCGTEFSVRRYRSETAKYCSRKCKNKNCTELISAICKICGKQFFHISSRCNKAKYCSRLCFHRSQIGRGSVEHTCLHCGKVFRDSPCKKRKYCSKKCVNKSSIDDWHPKYTTVRKKMIRQGVIKKCEKCGYDENIHILGVHHKDGNRKNNEKINLMVLCPNCHSLIHDKHISH